MLVVVMYFLHMNSCLSLCALFCHPIHVGDCSCVTLVINRHLWYAGPSDGWEKKKTQNKSGSMALVKSARRALIISGVFVFFVVCTLSIWISAVCRVSHSYWFVFAHHFNLCLIAFPQTVLVMHKMLRERIFFTVCFFSPFLNKATK